MRNRKYVKCFLGILLSICMISGMISMSLPRNVDAEGGSSNIPFTMGYVGDNTDGSLFVGINTTSDLSAYNGKKYEATVMVDGEEQIVDWAVAPAGTAWRLYSRLDVTRENYIPSDAKSIVISSGTVFEPISQGATALSAEAQLVITKVSGTWVSGSVDANFTMRWLEDYAEGDTYVALNLDKSTSSDLSAVYTSGTKFSSFVLVNGEKKTVTWEYIIAGETQLIRSSAAVDATHFISTDATRIEIPKGTVLIPATGTKKPVQIAKGLTLTEISKNNWVSGLIDMELSYKEVYPQTSFLQVQMSYQADLSAMTETEAYVYLDTEIDGAVVKKVKWRINKANEILYPDGTGTTVPATAKSVKIYAGTYSGGYEGTSCKIPIRIKKDVGAVYAFGKWYDASKVRMVHATYSGIAGMSNNTPQIQLTTDSITPDGWKGWFNGKAHVGDGEEEVNARFYFEPNAKTLLIGQNVGVSDSSDNVMKALRDHKKVKIKAQNELTTVQEQVGPALLSLNKDLILEWNGSEYTTVEEGPSEITTNVSYRSIIEGEEAYTLHLTVDNYEELVSEYGLWSWLEGKILVNGSERTVAFQLGSNLLATLKTSQNANAGLPTDTTSIKIPEGTVFSDVDNSSAKPLKVTNTFSYVKTDGAWYEEGKEPREVTTNVSYRGLVEKEDEYQLHLKVDNYDELVTEYKEWSWFEGKILVNGSERTVAFQLGGNLFATLKATQNANAGLPTDTTSIKIPAGTIFKDVDGSSTNPLKIANTFSYVKKDGAWYEEGKEPRNITTKASYRIISKEAQAYRLLLSVNNYEALVKEYGLWSWFEGKIQINGKERTVAFQLGSNLFASIPSAQNSNAGIPLGTTSIKIPAGTIFKDVDGSSANPLQITSGISLVNKYGGWYQEGQEPKVITTKATNRLLLQESDAYRMHLEVNNYDALVKEYGLWSWFEGEILVNGKKTTVAFNLGSDLFATFTSSQNTNAGIPLDATTIEIPAGTTFTDIDGSSASILKFANTIALEKEPVYGRWGKKGKVETPKKFNEIDVNVHALTGVYIALGAQTEPNKLVELYGKEARFYGAATVGDPEKGVYTNKNMLFNLSGDQLVTSTVQIGLMDSFTIKAGTILWPDESCKSLVPIRIMTDVRLTRDAEDDWVIKLNKKTVKLGETVRSKANGNSQTGIVSPKTSDGTPIYMYTGILLIALMCMAVCVIYKIRTKRKNDNWKGE